MKNEHSTYKITLLLYSIVIMIGVNIFFAHKLHQWMEEDAFVNKQMRMVGEAMQDMQLKKEQNVQAELSDEIDKRLAFINEHFLQQADNQLLAGFFNPQKQFASLSSCWEGTKKELFDTSVSGVDPRTVRSCRNEVHMLTKIVEKMVEEKHNRMLNTLYFGLLLTIVIAIVVIFYVKTYVKKQMIRHSIFDKLTKLYNRDYFLTEIKKACALSNRHERPLTVVFVHIDDFRDVSKEEGPVKSDAILSIFGELVLSLTRASDMACRFSEDEFAIITPDTDLKSVMVVAERLRKKVLNHEFNVQHPMTVSISVTQYQANEDAERYIQRGLNTMHEAKKERNRVLVTEAVQ